MTPKYVTHENLPVRTPSTKSTKYTEQFEEWLKEEKERGLLYVNIYYGDGLNKDTVLYEAFCEDFMRMQNYSDVSDPLVLGKHTPPVGF